MATIVQSRCKLQYFSLVVPRFLQPFVRDALVFPYFKVAKLHIENCSNFVVEVPHFDLRKKLIQKVRNEPRFLYDGVDKQNKIKKKKNENQGIIVSFLLFTRHSSVTVCLMFLSSWLRLFLSSVVDGKKRILQKLCLISKRGTASTFLVIYGETLCGITLYR